MANTPAYKNTSRITAENVLQWGQSYKTFTAVIKIFVISKSVLFIASLSSLV
jgi:hypothetical protein